MTTPELWNIFYIHRKSVRRDYLIPNRRHFLTDFNDKLVSFVSVPTGGNYVEMNLRTIGEYEPWLLAVANEARIENDILRRNGAIEAATARECLLETILRAAEEYGEEGLTVQRAAIESGLCEETIRRAVRTGAIESQRTSTKGKITIQRKAIAKLTRRSKERLNYDVEQDALSLYELRIAS